MPRRFRNRRYQRAGGRDRRIEVLLAAGPAVLLGQRNGHFSWASSRELRNPAFQTTFALSAGWFIRPSTSTKTGGDAIK
jgi:hypothetical protein